MEDKNEHTTPVSCKERLVKWFTVTQEGATPANWKLIFLVVSGLFGGAYSITFLFPFLPDMVLHFGHSEEDKGYYVGYVASGMFIGRMFTSFFWGWMSDQFGRRPIILSNLVFIAITNVAFGFSVNIEMAIATRILCGLFNGIVGASKSVLYEISDDTNQAAGMSAIAFAWGSGVVLGPVISGLLAQPSEKYPSVFPPECIFGTYPFLLPSLVAAFICIASFIVLWWALPETLQTTGAEESVVDIVEPLPSSANVLYMEILDNKKNTNFPSKSKSMGDLSSPKSNSLTVGNGVSSTSIIKYGGITTSSPNLWLAGSCYIYGDLGIHKTQRPEPRAEAVRSSSVQFMPGEKSFTQTEEKVPFINGALSGGASKTLEVINYKEGSHATHRNELTVIEECPERRESSSCCLRLSDFVFCRLIRSGEVMICIVLYTLFSFAVIGWDDVFVVWASTAPRLGGLGFSAQKIGVALGGSSTVLLFVQVFLYPKLVAKFSALKTLQGYGYYLIFISTCVAAFRYLLPVPIALWSLLMVCMAVQKMAVTSNFSTLSIFLNNSVRPQDAGSVNGVGMTFAAMGRAAAPPFCGSVFAWSITHGAKIGFPFDVNFIFIIMGVVFLGINIISAFTPVQLEKQKKGSPTLPEGKKVNAQKV